MSLNDLLLNLGKQNEVSRTTSVPKENLKENLKEVLNQELPKQPQLLAEYTSPYATQVQAANPINTEPTPDVDFLSTQLNKIKTADVFQTDLTAVSTEEDSLDYMARISEMPSITELFSLLSSEQETQLQKLNDEQKELLTLCNRSIDEIEESIDLKQIDLQVSSIMERLQENPEIISLVSLKSMHTLIGCFDRLYSVKATASKMRKEKKASTKSPTARQQELLAQVNEDELEF